MLSAVAVIADQQRRALVLRPWAESRLTPRVTGQGRGRRFEPPAGDGQLAHSRIAHAEINALAVLPPTGSYEDHRLLTTLEPCCMCLGAAVQTRITSVHFAAPDPYAGGSHLRFDTPQARRRPLTLHGPLHDERGWFAELLHLVWLLDQPADKLVSHPVTGQVTPTDLWVPEDARAGAFRSPDRPAGTRRHRAGARTAALHLRLRPVRS